MSIPAGLSQLGPLSFGRLDGELLLSNDAGRWARLDAESEAALLGGTLGPDHPRYAALAAAGFLREAMDVPALVERVRSRMAPRFQGTSLHILVVTLRCDHACGYCHASRVPMAATGADMSLDTARQAVDLAFQTSSPLVNFEFQGGEPLAAPDTVRFVLDYAREANKYHKKDLQFSLVTNLSRMREEYLPWLVAPDVAICTSLDGPADLHDENRHLMGGGSSFAVATAWLRRFRTVYAEAGLDPGLFHVEALLTATRASLGRARDIVDTYLELGLPALHLRPLNRYGFAAGAWGRIGYTPAEYLEFYFAALDAVIAANRAGHDLREQAAAVYLTKLLTPREPGHMDLRSPCGAAIGQLAYAPDGQVYTCDEGRMLARSGDQTFRVGHVAADRWSHTVNHRIVRAITLASTLETLPGCSECVYRPFCGVCPLQSWAAEGDLFARKAGSDRCALQKGQIEGLLRRLRDDADGSAARLFNRWTVHRERGEG